MSEGKSSRGKRTIVTVLAIAGLLVLILAGYLPRRNRVKALENETKTENETLPVVSVVKVKRSPVNNEIVLPGNIQAVTEATILARAEGYLKKRYVDIGDRVKAGQLLAELEAPELDQQVAQARASVSQAKAGLGQAMAALTQAQSNENLARVTADRWSVLVSKGVLSKQEGDQTQANYQSQTANRQAAESAVNAAKDNVTAVQANLSRLLDLQAYKRVRAPFTGVITARNVDTGSLIATGNTVLFRIAQIDILRIFVNAPQSNAPGIHAGQAAAVSTQEYPGRKFDGRITRTASSLDPNTRTLLTEVQLSNIDHVLLPGMYAQVKLENPRSEPPLLIPGDSLVTRADGTQVAMLQPGDKVHYQKIELGRDYGNSIEVVSGLADGQYVIVNPADDVREGVQVKATQAKEAPSGPGGATPRNAKGSAKK